MYKRQDDDIIAALDSGKVAAYVTDFPNGKTAAAKGVVAIPHLGASTPESEDNCAIMAADQVSEYMLRGNIVNSVNLPCLSLEPSGGKRVVVIATVSYTHLDVYKRQSRLRSELKVGYELRYFSRMAATRSVTGLN